MKSCDNRVYFLILTSKLFSKEISVGPADDLLIDWKSLCRFVKFIDEQILFLADWVTVVELLTFLLGSLEFEDDIVERLGDAEVSLETFKELMKLFRVSQLFVFKGLCFRFNPSLKEFKGHNTRLLWVSFLLLLLEPFSNSLHKIDLKVRSLHIFLNGRYTFDYSLELAGIGKRRRFRTDLHSGTWLITQRALATAYTH